MKIWLDDEYEPNEPGWTWTTNVQDTLDFLRLNPTNITDISLDHDLGDNTLGTGYDVLKYIEFRTNADLSLDHIRIHIHSGNPMRRDLMRETLRRIMEARRHKKTPQGMTSSKRGEN